MHIVYAIESAGAYNASAAFFGTVLLLGGALAGLFAFLLAQKCNVGGAWGLWVAQLIATALGSLIMPIPPVVFAWLFVLFNLIGVSVITCCGGNKNKKNSSSCCGCDSGCGSGCGSSCSGGSSSCCGCDGGSRCCGDDDKCKPKQPYCPSKSVSSKCSEDSEYVLQYRDVSYSATDCSRSC